MSNLAAYREEDISSAALLEEVRERLKIAVALWPNASDALASLRKVRKWMSILEITRAIPNGRILKRYREKRPVDCWVLSLIVFDSEGEPLGVNLHLPILRADIVQITEIIVYEPGFQPGCFEDLS